MNAGSYECTFVLSEYMLWFRSLVFNPGEIQKQLFLFVLILSGVAMSTGLSV